ncbi:MAG: hypothetical protein QNI84_11450 [Henriciella sp.]|nr:hypothetical protein [Henriciella sp.]
MKPISTLSLALVACVFSAAPAIAQSSDDITVTLDVQADTSIAVTGFQDVTFTSQGVASIPGDVELYLCVDTPAAGVNVTLTTLNPTTNGENSLTSPGVADAINYDVRAKFGVTFGGFVSGTTRSYTLSNFTPGQNGCPPDQYAYTVKIAPKDTDGGAATSINEVITANGLDDGVSRPFTDVATFTFEATL